MIGWLGGWGMIGERVSDRERFRYAPSADALRAGNVRFPGERYATSSAASGASAEGA
ncbi:MAG: hypothetical protein H8F28_01465 [Fibrella sp.]|nr:hypothetical protein [Armatimonadota bacterium]